MKTRREFFKILAGSMAVVAACVIAPKSLMAAKLKYDLPAKSCHGYKGYETSGYAQAGGTGYTTSRTLTTTTTTNSLNYQWNYIDDNGVWRKA